MNGGKEREAGEDRQAVPVQVPIGWQRQAEHARGLVIYISPSGSVLSSLEQVKNYLLTDGTCKCGLECPLVLHKVFNFDPGASVKQRTAEDVKADDDVTKLCIHKRKLLAVATLHRSLETHPPLTLSGSGSSTSQRAIRNKVHEAPPHAADCKNPFKMLLASGQQRLYGPPPDHADLYSGYARQQRLGSGDPGPKSPYRSGYGGMLSPPPPGAKLYADGSESPCADALGSPDGFARTGSCGFPGAGSPGSASVHGGSRTLLSPPNMMLHGSPAGQLSCPLTGRTSTPLSSTAAAKSPVMTAPRGGFSPTLAFHHKTPAPVPPPPSVPPPCAMQKRQMTSEKDPLGILDPIPVKSGGPAPNAAPSFQHSVHSQVAMMNVSIPPPTIVPLPSNLPLPTVKPGPVGHGLQRTQPGGSASPVHAAHARMEASPHRSRSSSTSSDHGGFAMPSGHQAPCGALKVPPRSPRSAMGSPRPAMPSSPSTNKADSLHPYKDSPMYSPTSSSPSSSSMASSGASQKGPPGILGMPLTQILSQQNAASFPASSLLSAAAKAQLANQNKSPAGGGGAAAAAPRGLEGHGPLNPMLPPNSTVLLTSPDGQSGRAALRDKLMAQQRDPMRKRKQAAGGANHDANAVYSMIGKPGLAGPPSATEQLRKVGRLGGLHPNTSMAQLLQSMSSHRPPTPGPLHYNDASGVAPQQNLLIQQRLRPGDALQHCHGARPYPDVLGHMQTAVSSCGNMGPDGMTLVHPNPPPLSHPAPPPQGPTPPSFTT